MSDGKFEKAARLKLRFNYKGQWTVEDLYDLSVQELDSIFKMLNSQLNVQKEESLLEVKSKAEGILGLKVEIIKHIVNVMLAEQEVAINRKLKATKKHRLLEIIAQKQDEEYYKKSPEELAKLIDEL